MVVVVVGVGVGVRVGIRVMMMMIASTKRGPSSGDPLAGHVGSGQDGVKGRSLLWLLSRDIRPDTLDGHRRSHGYGSSPGGGAALPPTGGQESLSLQWRDFAAGGVRGGLWMCGWMLHCRVHLRDWAKNGQERNKIQTISVFARV